MTNSRAITETELPTRYSQRALERPGGLPVCPSCHISSQNLWETPRSLGWRMKREGAGAEVTHPSTVVKEYATA